MIKGNRLYLRPFKQQDIAEFVEHCNNFESKGDFLQLNFMNLVEFTKKYNENGLWTEDHSRLLIFENDTNRMLGFIGFFKTAHYINGLEIGYTIFSPKDRGKGYCSEAVELVTEWLFLTKQIARLQICMDSHNTGSRKVAEKCGYTYEGTMRMAVYSRGKYNDLDVLSMTRPEFEKKYNII